MLWLSIPFSEFHSTEQICSINSMQIIISLLDTRIREYLAELTDSVKIRQNRETDIHYHPKGYFLFGPMLKWNKYQFIRIAPLLTLFRHFPSWKLN